MTYNVYKTDGNLLIQVLDGTADGPDVNPGVNSTSVNLIGKNYPTYGILQNENFVRMLENFANASAPQLPLTGQLWYDTTTQLLKVFDGTSFVPVTPIVSNSNGPTSPTAGSVWWDTVNKQFNIFDGAEWVLVGPSYSTASGKSGLFQETFYDTGGAQHTVVNLYVNGILTGVLSNDPPFTVNVVVNGMSLISNGFNLAPSVTLNGTATNSQTLSGLSANVFARVDQPTVFSSNVSVGGGNLSVTDATTVTVTTTKNFTVATNYTGTTTTALSVNVITGEVTVAGDPVTIDGVANKGYVDTQIATNLQPYAQLNSPVFTGIPWAPNPGQGTYTQQIATTKFVLDSLNTTFSSFAPIASPTFTGTPLAPTPAINDNSNKIATTAYVNSAINLGSATLWQGSAKYVSNLPPDSNTGNNGDFWFQI
jgi:hypothetical protein